MNKTVEDPSGINYIVQKLSNIHSYNININVYTIYIVHSYSNT